MYVLTVEQMRQAEKAADASGQTYELMMESAGQAVATAVRQVTGEEGIRILALIGPGNNGGDGLVAAYHLQRKGATVTCFIWKRAHDGDPIYQRAEEAGVRMIPSEEDSERAELIRAAQEADVIIDALLGTGVDRPLEKPLTLFLDEVRTIVEARRHHRRPWIREALQLIDPTLKPPQRPETPSVVAVDAPSGLNCDTGEVDPTTLSADVTVTFGFPKRGHFLFPGASFIGKLLIAEIGISPRLIQGCRLHLVTSQMVSDRLPPRPLDAHKGTFGKALIVAGSVNFVGAPALAGEAALRTGAGLVTLALPEKVVPLVAAGLREATYLLLPHTLGMISPDASRVLDEHLSDYQALLIGPGLGDDKEVARFVQEFLAGKSRSMSKPRARIGFIGEEHPVGNESAATPEAALPPLVVDADALNALSKAEEWWKLLPAGSVLTPHLGEMARLMHLEAAEVHARRMEIVQEAATQWDQVVLLKGAHSLVAEPGGEVYILPFATPTLATAGTGDVLAGIIVGLLAQGLKPLDAAIVGGFIHGLAAEELEFAQSQSCGSIAGDLLPYLPVAIHWLRS